MSIFSITLLTAIFLLILGGLLFWNGKSVSSVAKRLPRSKRFTLLAFGIGSLWFLYKVTQLGEADFGNYRNVLLALFASIAVLSYYFVPDFLGVRGICICFLLGAGEMLNSAFSLYDISTRLFLVVFAYILILLAIYLAVAPYRARDFFSWLFYSPGRPKLFGAITFSYGLVLAVSAFTY
tara:strand:+ start:4365 stop:4904 length:540 start_codon:yes stop_codon:yes gene_type:complete